MLLPNFPNPFNARTNFPFYVHEDQLIRLSIYNSKGQLVRSLVNEFLSGGYHEAMWDGKNETGIASPSGIYIAVLNGDFSKHACKVLLIN